MAELQQDVARVEQVETEANLDEAIRLARIVAAECARRFGDDDWNTLRAKQRLAELLIQVEDCGSARRLLEDVVGGEHDGESVALPRCRA